MTTASGGDGQLPPEPEQPFPPTHGHALEPDEQSTVILTPYGELPAYHGEDVLPSGPVGGRRRDSRRAAADEPREPRRPGPARRSREPRRPGGPRRTAPTPLGRVVLPLALALVCGVALVAAWSHLEDDRAAAAASSATSVVAPSGIAVVPKASPSPKATASATPKASASPKASVPAASPSTATTTADRSVPVVVLNATTRTGLAARVAARLRADGWTVVAIGNYRRGDVVDTTVFARGHARAVATMRRDLPTRDLVRRPVAGLDPARITVVLGRDYPRV